MEKLENKRVQCGVLVGKFFSFGVPLCCPREENFRHKNKWYLWKSTKSKHEIHCGEGKFSEI